MSGIVGSRLNARGSGIVGKLGSDGQLLTSAGAGKSIVFENAPSGSADLSFGGDNFGAAKVIGSNDSYSLSFETAGNTAMTVDESGATTKPLQPCFLCVPAAAQDNMTEESQNTVVFGTEVFDVGGDLACNTFTAPVAGKYYFSTKTTVAQIDHDGTYYSGNRIITSNRTYAENFSVRDFLDSQPDSFTFHHSVTADMDASDTAHITWGTFGPGSSQEDIYNSGDVEYTSFSGALLV